LDIKQIMTKNLLEQAMEQENMAVGAEAGIPQEGDDAERLDDLVFRAKAGYENAAKLYRKLKMISDARRCERRLVKYKNK